MKSHSRYPWKLQVLWMIRVMIFVSLACILIDPKISHEVRVVSSKASHIALVFDISRSMLTDDIAPSRIEKAKTLLSRWLADDHTNEFGYIIFAGKPFVLSPLSSDTAGLRNQIATTSTDMILEDMPDTSGTNIGDALLAADMMLSGVTDGRAIVLVTDGRANIGLDPLLAAEQAKLHKNPIFVVGIGSASGSLLSYLDARGVRQYFYDEKHIPMRADIDEITLKKIAETT